MPEVKINMTGSFQGSDIVQLADKTNFWIIIGLFLLAILAMILIFRIFMKKLDEKVFDHHKDIIKMEKDEKITLIQSEKDEKSKIIKSISNKIDKINAK